MLSQLFLLKKSWLNLVDYPPTPIYNENVIVSKFRCIYCNIFQAQKTINLLDSFPIFIDSFCFAIYLFYIFIYMYFFFFFLYGLVSLIIIYLLKSLIFFRNFFFFWPLLYQICNQLIQFVVIYAKRISLITNQDNLLLNEIYESKEAIKCISIEE